VYCLILIACKFLEMNLLLDVFATGCICNWMYLQLDVFVDLHKHKMPLVTQNVANLCIKQNNQLLKILNFQSITLYPKCCTCISPGAYNISVEFHGRQIVGGPFKSNAYDVGRITISNLPALVVAGTAVKFDSRSMMNCISSKQFCLLHYL